MTVEEFDWDAQNKLVLVPGQSYDLRPRQDVSLRAMQLRDGGLGVLIDEISSPLSSVPLTAKPSGERRCVCVTQHRPEPVILHSHHKWPLGEGGPDISSNLLWLCLPGSMPVTMADGSLRRMDCVGVGDVVFGHDGQPHHVTGVKVSSSTETIVRLDDLLLTADHLVLTRSGWLPAGCLRKGDEVCRLEVSRERVDTHVLSLVSAEPQILRPVVVGNQVDVVHNLGAGQGSTDGILHHHSRTPHLSALTVIPQDQDDVALVVQPTLPLALGRSGHALECSQAAGVAAEQGHLTPGTLVSGSELAAALTTRTYDGRLSSSGRGASVRAGGVLRGQRRRHLERFAADGTFFLSKLDVATPQRRWDTLTHVERAPHDGQLYDITISGSQSFIAGGLAVHNCPTSHNNVHELWRLLVKAGKTGVPLPWREHRRFSEYVRGVVARGYAQAKEAGQVP